MTKKTLAEAAADILGANLRAKQASGDSFGQGKSVAAVAPGNSTSPENLGGLDPKTATPFSGDPASKVSKAAYPGPGGSAADPGGEKATQEIKSGQPGKDRAKVDNSGVVTEEEIDEELDEELDEEAKEEDDEDEDEGSEEDKAEDKKEKENMKEEGTLPDLGDGTGGDGNIPDPEPVSAKVAAYVKGKTGVSVTEDINAIFSGSKLSEDFKKKAATIYEAALIATATNVCEQLEEQYAAILEQVTEQIQEEMTEKVDDYLNYMVEEWVRENEIAIETGLRSELVEDFIGGLKKLFTEHYIEIPDDKVNVVEELASKVEELETSLNEEIARNVEMKKALSEQFRQNVVRQVAEGLTETQVEKLVSLAEGVDFTSEKEFKDSIVSIRESYFPTNKPASAKPEQLDEGTGAAPTSEEEPAKPAMNNEIAQYAKAISKTLPR